MPSHRRLLIVTLAGLLSACSGFGTDAVVTETVARLSNGLAGIQANGPSTGGSISDGGLLTAFSSDADNLVANDTNGNTDIFLHNAVSGAITRLSVLGGGQQATGNSTEPALSGDGTGIAFSSTGTTLTGTIDGNNATDVFWRSIATPGNTLISVNTGGGVGNGASGKPAINGDGTLIAFQSDASDLIVGDSNNVTDIFVRDRTTPATRRVSVDGGGFQANGPSTNPVMDGSGTRIAFQSDATNLVLADTNGQTDVFLRDTSARTTVRISVDTGGFDANGPSTDPAISNDGQVIAFQSDATDLITADTNTVTDIFVRDLSGPVTTRVSVSSAGVEANGPSSQPAISGDGRYVAFISTATNLVLNDTNGTTADLFVHDRVTGDTILVTEGPFVQANGPSNRPDFDLNGNRLVFDSAADNLILVDTNRVVDLFATTPVFP